MTRSTVALGELLETGPASGRVESSGWPVFAVTKHAGFVPSLEYFKKQVFSRDTSGYKRVRAGQFAYATIHLDEGSIGIAPTNCLISPMYTVFDVNSDKVHPEYLLRFMKSPQALAQYPRFGKGTVHRRKAISLGALSSLEVPLPPIQEQRRIAAILDHADSILRLRRESVERLASLGMAAFISEFGDGQDASDEGVLPLEEILDSIENGRSPVCESRPRQDGEFGVLKLGAVTYGKYRPSENKAYLGQVVPTDRLVRQGDVLMTRKNTPDLVGAVALVEETPERLLLPDLVFRLNYDPKVVTGPHLQKALMVPKTRASVRRLASGSAASMSNISKARLLKLRIPIPPLSRQKEFDRRIAGLETEITKTQRHEAEMRRLTDTLQLRAFSGRL